jgi:hypothetical protein
MIINLIVSIIWKKSINLIASELFIWIKINNRDEFTCHWFNDHCNKRSIFCEWNKRIYLDF